MILVDKYTILHVIELVATIVVFVLGLHKENEYTITYILNDKIYRLVSLKKNAEVEAIELPIQEGQRFTGWDMEIPENMPKEDLVVHGALLAY